MGCWDIFWILGYIMASGVIVKSLNIFLLQSLGRPGILTATFHLDCFRMLYILLNLGENKVYVSDTKLFLIKVTLPCTYRQ